MIKFQDNPMIVSIDKFSYYPVKNGKYLFTKHLSLFSLFRVLQDV